MSVGEHGRRGASRSRLLRVVAVFLSLVPGTTDGQTRASLGLGIGTVRLPPDGTGGPVTFNSAVLSPSIEWASSGFATTFGGSVASLPLGEWSTQGRADLWGVTPAVRSGLRAGVELIGAGVTRTDGSWSAAAHAVAELVWAARSGGIAFGVGPSSGWIASEPSVTALHTRARVWWRVGRASYALNVEPTRFPDGWFTDASTGLTWAASRVVTSFWVVGRLSDAFGSKGTANAALQLFPSANLAIEIGGGGYLSEPYQGLSRTSYFSAGLRLFTSRHSRPTTRPARAWPALVPQRVGDSVVVRFLMKGARSVAIAGDWNAWQPHELRSRGGDLWQGALAIPAGTHHFTLLVDGRDWVVPDGVALLPDGLGGIVGLLLVP